MSGFTESSSNDSPALAFYRQADEAANRGELTYAERLCRKAARLYERAGKDEVSVAYHKLGMIAYWQGDLDAADEWYRKALQIDERTGNEHGAALTCNNLSAIANDREDFDSAETWCWKSLHIKEKRGDEAGAATSYHQLGVVARRRQDLEAAEQWYLKALEIDERLTNNVRVAQTCFNLSEIATVRRDSEAAEEWLRKALDLFDKEGDADGVIALGRIAEREGHFEYAERLYREALQIAKRNGNEASEANCYAYLGFLAGQQGDYDAAREWYEQSFSTNEKRRAMDFAAKDCISLGNLSLKGSLGNRPDFNSAARWFRTALRIDPNARWWDWLKLYARLWRYKYLKISK